VSHIPHGEAREYHKVVTRLNTSRKRLWESQRWKIREAWQAVNSVPRKQARTLSKLPAKATALCYIFFTVHSEMEYNVAG